MTDQGIMPSCKQLPVDLSSSSKPSMVVLFSAEMPRPYSRSLTRSGSETCPVLIRDRWIETAALGPWKAAPMKALNELVQTKNRWRPSERARTTARGGTNGGRRSGAASQLCMI